MSITGAIQAGVYIAARPEGQKPKPHSKHEHEAGRGRWRSVSLRTATMPVVP
jgi:hypothetical protein